MMIKNRDTVRFRWKLTIGTNPVRSRRARVTPSPRALATTLVLFVGWVVFAPSPMALGRGEGETTKQRKHITLSRCLRLAVENNFSLKSSRFAARSTGTAEATARAEFDPVLNSAGSYRDATTPTASSLEGTSTPGSSGSNVFVGNLGPGFPSNLETETQAAVPQQQNYAWDLTLTKKFDIGTRAALSYRYGRFLTNQFFATINPSYSSSAILDLAQPLLRGGWLAANLSNLRQSENQVRIAKEQLRTATHELVFNVQTRYWDLVYALEDLEVKRESLRLAEILKRDNLEKFRAGTMTKLDVTQADFEIASRKNEVILAVNTVKNTMDQLRQFVDPEGLEQRPGEEWFPVDRPLQKGSTAPPLDSALKSAFMHRADWQEALLNFTNSEINEDASRNGLLPRLDFLYRLQYSGVGDNSVDPFRDVLRGEFDTWSVGLELEFPLGNRAARAGYLKATLDRRRVQADVEELRSQIHLEIRESIRGINTTLDAIKQTREALRFAREQLKGEQARLDVGKSTSYKVLEIQEDLAQALINERRALLDHMIAKAKLELAQGTILEYFGLVAPRSDKEGTGGSNGS